jgi:hypothetical protein
MAPTPRDVVPMPREKESAHLEGTMVLLILRGLFSALDKHSTPDVRMR